MRTGRPAGPPVAVGREPVALAHGARRDLGREPRRRHGDADRRRDRPRHRRAACTIGGRPAAVAFGAGSLWVSRPGRRHRRAGARRDRVAPVVPAELPARPPRRPLPEIGASRRVAPGRVLAVASAGAGLAFVDATIVNVAFPDMQADFAGTSLSALSWILNAYNIVFAAFLVAAGRLADLAGRRRTFQAGVVLFTLASVACAAAPTVELLVAARVLQALGAAITVPASLALVLTPTRPSSAPTASRCGPPARRSPPGSGRRSAARWSSSAAGGSPSSSTSRSASPLPRRAPDPGREPRAGPPHAARPRGRGLAALAIGALTLGIVQGEEWGWTSPPVLAAFAAAPLLGAAVRAPLPPAPRRRCSTSTCCGSARCPSRTC